MFKNFYNKYGSETIFFATLLAGTALAILMMLPVATHGEVNPICDALVDHITCTTSP